MSKASTQPSSSPSTRSLNPRLAALAAAEARLKGQAEQSDESATAVPEPVIERWVQPSEEDDMRWKRELARALDRGIVRDNGYKECAECVEVSWRSFR
jgi:hypothetical protein